MNGETVSIIRKIKTGEDERGNPVYSESLDLIENVLVAPGPRQDTTEENRPDGVIINYTLHFPKTFDERLKNQEIIVRGERCKVIGCPDHYTLENCPTEWWMPVEVSATDG